MVEVHPGVIVAQADVALAQVVDVTVAIADVALAQVVDVAAAIARVDAIKLATAFSVVSKRYHRSNSASIVAMLDVGATIAAVADRIAVVEARG